MLKKIAFLLLTTVTMMSASTVAIADSRTSSGGGGDYNYELWQSTDNTHYYLKIWDRKTPQNTEPSHTSYQFSSSREALEYFDCNYAKKSLPSCPHS